MRQGGAHICWPVRDGLFLGGALAAKDKQQMKYLGITHIINVVGEGVYNLEWMGGKAGSYFPNDFKYQIIRTSDQSDQDLMPLFPKTTGFIQDALRAGGGVLVHCFAGVCVRVRDGPCVLRRHSL